ncbi:MAG: hypothetical protein LBV60_18165 [Streptomyces sp.]|jgi:hypothetical protein|nr:hypothetical protein [Streptomyces sp.]
MRAIRAASVALLGLTALACTAPASVAQGGENPDTRLIAADSSGNGYGGQGNGNGSGNGNSLFGGQGNGNGYGNGNTLFGGQGNGNGYGNNQYGGGGGGGGGYSQGGSGSRDRPDYEQHGVRAGAGGSIGGFDLKKIGLGAALIAAPLGVAWRMSRRRTVYDKS